MFLVPYVPGMLHPATAALDGAELRELDRDDDTAYWRLVADEWAKPGDLTIVEQDIVPGERVLQRMRNCHHPWCVSPYRISTTVLIEGLGCVRFRECLKRRHPDLMRRVGEIRDDGQPAKDWHRLDTRIARLLRQLDYGPHCHGMSEHVHDYTRRP